MLINNATIITQNRYREVIPHGFIYIENDSIVTVESGDYEGDLKSTGEIIDASGYIVSPGFINAHVHLGETIYTSLMDGWYNLEKYIEFTNKISSISKTIESARQSICDYSLMQLIKSGTTTIAGGRTNESSETFGVRNISAYMLMQSPKLGKFSEDIEKQFEKFDKGINRLITHTALFIHSLGTVSDEILSRTRDLRKRYTSLLIMVHVAETKKVEVEAKKRFGLTSVQTLQKYDLLNERTLLVHGNNLSPEDVSLICHSKSPLVHCLSSNLRVADNTADIWSLMQKGIPVSIATDGAATAGTFSVLSEARRCYSYHNRFHGEEHCIPAQEILDMITINPAKALGMSAEIGSIEPTKKADIIFLRKNSFAVNQPANHLLMDDSIIVEGVIIGGKQLLWKNELLIRGESEITTNFFSVIEKVKSDISFTRLPFE